MIFFLLLSFLIYILGYHPNVFLLHTHRVKKLWLKKLNLEITTVVVSIAAAAAVTTVAAVVDMVDDINRPVT